jgi:serine phosphatase RsbU (regulator of sigma subunit)
MRRFLRGWRHAPQAGGAPAAPGDKNAGDARFVSLRARLVALVMLVLLPWLALVLYTQAEERRTAIAHVNADAMRLIRIVTSNQAAQIEGARQLLTALVRLPQLREEPGRCDALLTDMLKAYPLYLNLGLIDPHGNIVCSAVKMRGPVNVADRAYFARAMQTRSFVMGDYQVGRVTQLPSINYAYPVLDDGGNLQSVLYAAQSLSWLTLALADVPLPPEAILIVTDAHGTVLARVPQLAGGIGGSLVERNVPTWLSMQRDGGVFESDDAQGVPRLWSHAPLAAGLDVHAIIGVPRSVAFADIDRRFERNLLALGAVTLVALAAAWFGAKLLLRQVYALVAATRELASGDLAARASVARTGSELDLLARAFNRMASMLETRDRELRSAEEKTRAAEVELAVTRAHLDIARQIQQSLLPQESLELGEAHFAGRCVPAVAVGGDYFGYFEGERNRIDSFVGDVSGHGVGAALLMAEARTTFLAERLAASGAGAVLTKLNALLHDDLDRSGLFMTACCATYDGVTRELAYANAGHPPALLLRGADDRCESIAASGVLLGIDRNARFAEVKVKLQHGDIVVFYTDGITETQDAAGEMFGTDRLGEAIVAHRHRDAQALVDGVLATLDRFAGSSRHEDDLTLVALKIAA